MYMTNDEDCNNCNCCPVSLFDCQLLSLVIFMNLSICQYLSLSMSLSCFFPLSLRLRVFPGSVQKLQTILHYSTSLCKTAPVLQSDYIQSHGSTLLFPCSLQYVNVKITIWQQSSAAREFILFRFGTKNLQFYY